jgi:hypothetical protein
MNYNTFKLEFTEQELNTILQGLGELPARVSLALILKIRENANKQLEKLKEIEEKEIT